jgi:uncharacterized radical SAM superfamily protein
VWWCILVIPELRRLKEKDLEFTAHLGYIARHYLKKVKIKNVNNYHSA